MVYCLIIIISVNISAVEAQLSAMTGCNAMAVDRATEVHKRDLAFLHISLKTKRV